MMKIDRKKLVTRHNIKNIGENKCFPLGNGEFCFTCDFTGLQTFKGNSMSHWGWHSFPIPEGIDPDKIPETGCYMDYYPDDGIEMLPKDKQVEINYIIRNPHPLNLGRVRFVQTNGELVRREDIIPGEHILDIYNGIFKTEFTYKNCPVTVSVLSFSDQDGIMVRIETDPTLHDLEIEIIFPYPSLEITDCIGDFTADSMHSTTFEFHAGNKYCLTQRIVDSTSYAVQCTCNDGSFVRNGSHSLKLNLAESGISEFTVVFHENKDTFQALSYDFEVVKKQTAQHWHKFWNNGGAIDLSRSKDPRWFELERKIVLSQYILAVQSAGSYPSAEAGLMNLDSWFGCFHMEMTWWHIAHYALWGRMDMADQQLTCFQKFLPIAEKLAKQLGKKGIKWGKGVCPDGRSAPWMGNLSLYWKQPHPIFFAELEYRNRPNEQTLHKWDDLIYRTAEHMADCVVKRKDGYYHLPKVMPPSELGFTDDPVFDLAYWNWALGIANDWQERLGKTRIREWDNIRKNIAPLPVKDNVYLRSAEWINTYEKQNYEHPDPVGVYGMLPLTDYVDVQIVKNTLNKIWQVWQKDKIWGWDFAWISMCASRVEEPQIAVDSLMLMKIDEIGANDNGSYPYLPANGGLLYAAAMMCVGKNGEHAPGFPKGGQWNILYENIMNW
ncbi:MAG: hypothetical protein IJ274_13475 [Lachnospiraceae bacterium]|nr:hypothetical protein [Lachnospiraceae bacterium]